MPGPLAPLIRYKVLDSDGAPVAGAKFYTYLSGSSTPQVTYSDSALTTPHTNPVVASAGGVLPPIYFAAVAYRVTITDAAGATIYAATDNVYDFAQLYAVQKDASGNVAVSGTLSVAGLITTTVGQIAFPATQVPSAGANTLDDYEEGAWTPGISAASGSGQTYSQQAGEYIKIGRQVTLNFRISLTSKGTLSGETRITGMPFTNGPGYSTVVIGFWDSLTTAVVWVGGTLGPSAAIIALKRVTAAAVSVSDLTAADLANATTLQGSITYFAAN